MSDDAIRAAIAKRTETEARIRKLEGGIRKCKEQIIEINNFIKTWEKFSGRSADGLSESKSLREKGEFVVNVDGQSVRVAPVNSRKEEVASAAREILTEAGRKLSRTELFKALTERGLIIRGSNPEMVLSTMLWRTKDDFGIDRLKEGGYCLRGKAEPADIDDTADDVDEDIDE